MLRKFLRQIAWLATGWLAWSSQVVVYGQEDVADDTRRGNWALCYALVVLGVALGMLVVGRPGKRKVLETDD